MSGLAFDQAPAANEPRVASATLAVVAARYVTIELAEAMTGLTESAMRTKMSRGFWVEGRQYIRRDGRVFIDMRGYERWVEAGQA